MYISILISIGQPTRRNTRTEWIVPFSSLLARKIFSLDLLHSDLRQGKLSYVIARPCNRIDEMLDLAQYDYHCTDTLYGYFLYTPYNKVAR